MISSRVNLIYELTYELPNDLRLRKSGNINKNSNLGGDIAQCQVSLPEIKLCQYQQKKHAKVDIKLFLTYPVLLDFSALFQIFCPVL